VTPGQKLREKRLESRKSLEQISALTKIHIKILSAIEEDRYSELPAKAFTRGFIVNYAKTLKLDPDAFLFEHHDFLESRFQERHARDQGHLGYAFEGKELEQNRRWTWVILSIVGGFTLAVVLIFKPGNHKAREKHKEYSIQEPSPESLSAPGELAPPELSPAIAALNPAPTGSPLTPASPAPAKALAASAAVPSATPAPSPATLAQSGSPQVASPTPSPEIDKLNKGDDLSATDVKLKLVIVAAEDSWTRYKVDQKDSGILILRSGRTLVIKAKNRILFETNPAAKLQFKTRKTPLTDLSMTKFEMLKEGEIVNYSGTEMGRNPLSDTIPPPRAPAP
jgi:cytoskeletal protein RodZ